MTREFRTIGDGVFKEIGAIAVYWAALESQMELAILGIQEIKMNTGMILTSSLGFRALHDLLMTIANGGGLNNETKEQELKVLLARINNAYPKRNGVIHTSWRPTDNPDVAQRMGIRAKGKLKLIDEIVTRDDLAVISEEIRAIGVDFTSFMAVNNIRPKHADHDAP